MASTEEMPFDNDGRLLLDTDPKRLPRPTCARRRWRSTAPSEESLRVPGIVEGRGHLAARRRARLRLSAMRQIGVGRSDTSRLCC
jgi:hypothetical protein